MREMDKIKWIPVTFFLISIYSINCNDYDISIQQCALQTSCKSCMESSPLCAWCSEWSYSNSTIGKLRCSSPQRLEAFGCPIKAIRKARKGNVKIRKNDEFQDVVVDQIPVQLRPQKISIKLRPNSTESVKLKYRPAKNYPLDLYYLMDLTWSMKDDKDTLVGLGSKMAHTLGTFTTNFRLGFGSYADKPLMPYIFPGQEHNPCQSQQTTCAPIYSFKHRMQLTDNVQRFIEKVNASDVTGNADNLEGGLDGVVQAVVCDKQIGWARQARKLMLVATNGFLHFAGDGKLGGVVDRHDFACHLDDTGEYTMSKKFDYPSLAEISRLLHTRKVNLIFAVTENCREEYTKISELLREKARVATLTANSSNILDIIERAYHEIVSKVVLRDNSTPELKVEYYSNCGRKGSEEMLTSECDELVEGKVYEFRVDFTLNECPRNQSSWKQRVVIEDALASEASEAEIDVEYLCGCDCGAKDESHCEHGVDECGICKCDFGWSGETCNCNETSWAEDRLQCYRPGDNKICSNRGECTCGACTCDPGYNGKFCECSPCDKIDGIECGGKGTCECGSCVCIDGWQGDSCKCPSGDKLCIAPGSNDVCANHGYCDCGQCRCNVKAPSDGLLYRGTYCESSASAGGSGLCILYEDCVNATVEDSKNAKKHCEPSEKAPYRIEIVDQVDTESDHYCIVRKVRESTVCTIPYVYQFNEDNTVLLKIGQQVCRTPAHVAFIPGLIMGIIVILGIIGLLIWKCWTAIKDKREFAKFEQERKRTVYALALNPIYRPATSVFRVPSMYKED